MKKALSFIILSAVLLTAAEGRAQFYSQSSTSDAALTTPVQREPLPNISAPSGPSVVVAPGGDPGAPSTGWGSGSATSNLLGNPEPRNANADGYCNDEVAKAEMAARMKEIDDRVALAKEMYSPTPAGGFWENSCLGRLFGMDVLFAPPDFRRLQDNIIQAVCNVALRYASQARQEGYAQFTNSLRQNGVGGGGLPLGNIIPGVNLNSHAGGVNFGQSGSPGVRTNLRGLVERADGGFGAREYFTGGAYGTTNTWGSSLFNSFNNPRQ
jgi:hypothetical protein